MTMTTLITWSHTDEWFALWSGLLILVLAPEYLIWAESAYDDGYAEFDVP